MKHLLISLIVSSFTFAQDFTKEELVIPFIAHNGEGSLSLIELNKGSYKKLLSSEFDYEPSLPPAEKGFCHYQRKFYQTNDNRFVEFIWHVGKSYMYKEWSDSLKTDLLHYGELERNGDSLELVEAIRTSSQGEDSLILDSIYTFRKVGVWEFRMNDGSKLFGAYRFGQRYGEWTHYLNIPYTYVSFLPVLATYEFEEGKLKSSKFLNKSTANHIEKLKILTAEWKSFPLDAKGTALNKQGNYIGKFERAGNSKFPCSNHFMGAISCGTVAERSPLKWEVKENNTIVIEGSTYTVLYLTEAYLILKLVE